MAHQEEIFSRILEKYYSSLTAAEKRIADYILKHPHETVTFSVTSLAERAGTSEATVVRFARTLGFKGFLELKTQLLRRASRDLAFPERLRKNSQSQRSLEYIVSEAEIANINETIGRLDREAFTDFAGALRDASIVYTLGSGMSSFLSRMATYQLTLIGKRSVSLPESACTFEETLSLATPGEDVLWVFSFPPYSTSVLRTVEEARSRGIPVLAITDRRLSPVVPQSRAALFAANNNILPVNSIGASLVLMTALLSRVAMESRNTEYAKELATALDAVLESPAPPPASDEGENHGSSH